MFTKYAFTGLFLSWIPNPQRISFLFDHSYLGYPIQSSKSVSPWDYIYLRFPILKKYRSQMLIQSSILPTNAFTRRMVVSLGLVHDIWRIWCPLFPLNQGGNPYSFSCMEEIFYSLSIRETSLQSLSSLILHQYISYLFFCGDIVVAIGLLLASYLTFDLPRCQTFYGAKFFHISSSWQGFSVPNNITSNFDLSGSPQSLYNFVIKWFIYHFQGVKRPHSC